MLKNPFDLLPMEYALVGALLTPHRIYRQALHKDLCARCGVLDTDLHRIG